MGRIAFIRRPPPLRVIPVKTGGEAVRRFSGGQKVEQNWAHYGSVPFRPIPLRTVKAIRRQGGQKKVEKTAIGSPSFGPSVNVFLPRVMAPVPRILTPLSCQGLPDESICRVPSGASGMCFSKKCYPFDAPEPATLASRKPSKRTLFKVSFNPILE